MTAGNFDKRVLKEVTFNKIVQEIYEVTLTGLFKLGRLLVNLWATRSKVCTNAQFAARFFSCQTPNLTLVQDGLHSGIRQRGQVSGRYWIHLME